MGRRWRVIVFLCVSAAVISAALFLPRIAQAQSYHDFADQRSLAGIPNFGNVVSNVAFLVCGVYGIIVTLRRRRTFVDRREVVAYFVLFAGLLLTAFGSGYYDLHPDNASTQHFVLG